MTATDCLVVGDLTQADLGVLQREAVRLEAGQTGAFTTSLYDSERRYLDIMAELFRRGALPGGGGCRPGEGCGGKCSCCQPCGVLHHHVLVPLPAQGLS